MFNMAHLEIAGIVVAGIIWVFGSISTLTDLLDNGKSLKDYRKQYGKDLGMLVCCTYRGLMFTVWPVMGFFGFLFGLTRDVIRLFIGDKVTTEKVQDADA